MSVAEGRGQADRGLLQPAAQDGLLTEGTQLRDLVADHLLPTVEEHYHTAVHQGSLSLSVCVSPPLSLSLFLSLFLSLCLSVCLSLPLFVCLSFAHWYFSLPLSLSLSLCISQSLCLSLSLLFCYYLCLSLCVSLSLSACLSPRVSTSLSHSISTAGQPLCGPSDV